MSEPVVPVSKLEELAKEPVDDFQKRINRVDTSLRNEYDLALIQDLHNALKEGRRAASTDALRGAAAKEREEILQTLDEWYMGTSPFYIVMDTIRDRGEGVRP